MDASTTRPTLARVKESIFNLIQGKVVDSTVLDLFAGSGAFGAECVSRGAKMVCFVDCEQKAIDTIKANTKNMSEPLRIIKSDFVQALHGFSREGVKFDLVYLDPPYKSDYAQRAMDILQDFELLSDGATIIVEHQFENDLQNIKECYIMKKSKKYGIALVDIFEYRV